LPLKAARLDAIAKLKTFWGFEPELQTNPVPFHLNLPWGATLMLLRACAMDRTRMGKKFGPILSRLWEKVCEILGQCWATPALPKVFARLIVYVIEDYKRRRYSPRLEVVEKPNKCKKLTPNFFSGGMTPSFLRQVVSAIYCPPSVKVVEFRLRSLAIKWNSEFTEGG